MRPKRARWPANRPKRPSKSLRRRVGAPRFFEISTPGPFIEHFFNGLLVGAGEIDFGLVMDPPPTTQLQMQVMRSIPIGVAMPAGHALAGHEQLLLGQTLDWRHIVPAESLLVGDRVKALYARHVDAIRYAIRCNNVEMMRALVLSGAGIAVMSWLDVFRDVQEGRLAFVPLSQRQAKSLSLCLCVAPQRQLSRAAQWAMEKVREDLKALSLSKEQPDLHVGD